MIPAYVLDTSLFTNPDVFRQFGADTRAAVREFVHIAQSSGTAFYMPTSIYEELCQMKELDGVAPAFESLVNIRSPRRHALQIPATIVYEFIDEVRRRIDRGLRIAEEHARQGHAATGGEVGRLITRLRERYREALRRGLIDSREDLDVLLLAMELDGIVVTADEGLRIWADKLGVKILLPQHLKGVLLELVERQVEEGSDEVH